MEIRRHFFPRTVSDFCCFLMVFVFVPLTFVFQMAVVLPEFHRSDSSLFFLTWVLGLFVLSNIVGNMSACMIVETSIKCVLLRPPIKNELRKLWVYCCECETLRPPRAWHCETCKTCILKRDHHCFFTGYCIGHRNHRYFVYFLFYLTIGAAYTAAYSSAYFWWKHADTYVNRSTAIKMVFPLLMFIFDVSWNNLYLLIYEMNVFALAYMLILITHHAPKVLHGAAGIECRPFKYDLGWRLNLEMVLGARMHLTWISPLICSALPNDGVNWNQVLRHSSKHR